MFPPFDSSSNSDYRWAFCEYDKDGDGEITVDELRVVLSSESPDKVQGYIKEFDTNGDGKISYEASVTFTPPPPPVMPLTLICYCVLPSYDCRSLFACCVLQPRRPRLASASRVRDNSRVSALSRNRSMQCLNSGRCRNVKLADHASYRIVSTVLKHLNEFVSQSKFLKEKSKYKAARFF